MVRISQRRYKAWCVKERFQTIGTAMLLLGAVTMSANLYKSSILRHLGPVAIPPTSGGRGAELRFFYQEGTSRLFPGAWDEYVAPIPEEERHDTITAYHAQLNSADEETSLRAAKAWSKWEQTSSKLYVDPAQLAQDEDDKRAIAFARIENHYFVNDVSVCGRSERLL
ncbi:hypothetical protein DAEQUDRAFT_762104 [Daedalea quercina L-15889]|uniref:Uncharacterized protein n=1 Tax=Daedalea quercina L-15889 TaxID=1314783 RepID=A0A165TML7_9APHY|nr:hypothetical protein DAEQUDRAFT_762104 [Daedalea quercina L-15889]